MWWLKGDNANLKTKSTILSGAKGRGRGLVLIWCVCGMESFFMYYFSTSSLPWILNCSDESDFYCMHKNQCLLWYLTTKHAFRTQCAFLSFFFSTMTRCEFRLDRFSLEFKCLVQSSMQGLLIFWHISNVRSRALLVFIVINGSVCSELHGCVNVIFFKGVCVCVCKWSGVTSRQTMFSSFLSISLFVLMVRAFCTKLLLLCESGTKDPAVC